MLRPRAGLAVVLVLSCCLLTPSAAGSPGGEAPLTFAQRVAAQEIIERLGYGYQLDARIPFEQAVPRAVLERKVARYIAQSRALERLWNRPLSEPMLQQELERIARNTKFPDRLGRLFQALGDDPRLIRETLVRAELVDRLARAAFAMDPMIHAPDGAPTGNNTFVSKRTWEEWWQGMESRFLTGVDDLQAESDRLSENAPLPALATCLPDDTWLDGMLDDVPDPRFDHTAVWTGREMIVWGGLGGKVFGTGSRYDPVTDTWALVTLNGAPTPRYGHSAIWTGSSMVIWGGISEQMAAAGDGARYDPATDTWSAMSTQGGPSPRFGHTAVWTGHEMIVWGGDNRVGVTFHDGIPDGGRYDPETDSWSPLEQPSEAPAAFNHKSVWTGREMIIWGGFFPWSDNGLRGAAYDPVTRTWRLLTANGTPSPRRNHIALWTGKEMIVWGGFSQFPTSSGARYDPDTDTWTPIVSQGAPPPGLNPSGVWTGQAMLVAGAAESGAPYLFRYEPDQDRWTRLTAPILMPGEGRTTIWTGQEMILWGGASGDYYYWFRSGLRYRESSDAWAFLPLSAPGQPVEGVPVWTGREMIVVGGYRGPGFNNGGLVGRYDPLLDRWSGSAPEGTPAYLPNPLVTWTGEEILVWGQSSSSPPGLRYDPLQDRWRTMSMEGAPEITPFTLATWTGSEWILMPHGAPGGAGARYRPATDTWQPIAPLGTTLNLTGASAVWSGQEMILWGAPDPNAQSPNWHLGGRYSPATDTWHIMRSGPPKGSYNGNRSLWIGDRMLVLGGSGSSAMLIYDPVQDFWSASLFPHVSRLSQFSAVWTGRQVLVWGGFQLGASSEAGHAFDPATGLWTRLSTQGAPAWRAYHHAFWTGSYMLVYGGGLPTGGAYVTGQSLDDDGDGLSECGGDCNDAKAAVSPEGIRICGDGLNNDCLDPAWPALAGTNEADDDRDALSECDGDCLDTEAAVHPGALDLPGNLFDEDCDGHALCDPAAQWPNPGRFMTCVSRACNELAARRQIDREECGRLVSQSPRALR